MREQEELHGRRESRAIATDAASVAGSVVQETPRQEHGPIVVREARHDDAEAISALLEEQFPTIPPDRWTNLLNYAWCPDKPNSGFVLLDGTEIVGFNGTIYSDREIGGRRERFCNGSSCYVRPQYRAYSMDLILAFLRQPGYTLTSLTPNPLATRVLEALGYRLLEHATRFIPPLVQSHTLLNSLRLRVLTGPIEIEPHLSGSDLQILRDHAPYACRHYLALSDKGTCYIVTRSISKYGMRFSEVLYASDPAFMVRHLERIKLRILFTEKALWLMMDERMLSPRPPLSLRRTRLRYFISDSLSANDIDNLYTEYVLIPEIR